MFKGSLRLVVWGVRNPAPLSLLPAGLAAVSNGAAGIMVHSRQAAYPSRFVAFQSAMLGAAWLLSVPRRWVWIIAFVRLLAGVAMTALSVGVFHIPVVATAGRVMVSLHAASPGGNP